MSNKKEVARSTLMIIIFTLGSKILGFLREVLLAAKFGSGIETDTFFISLSAAALLGNFLQSAINTTYIPVISEVESKNGKDDKIKYTNNLINIIILISLIFIILALIGTPLIVKLLASGFEGEQFDLAVQLTRMGLPMILFSGLIGILLGYLQSEQKFKSTAIIGFPLNIIYIFYLLFLSSYFKVKGLMIAAVIAVITQLLIQIPEAKSTGFKYKVIFDIKDIYIRKILYLSLPAFVSVALNDLNAIVDKTLASTLISGSISSLNYAMKLNQLIMGVFISAITTVVFPILSKGVNNDNMNNVKKTMSYGINLILLITIPATVGMIILARPIVELAFQRGEFNSIATIMTSQALIFYSLGLVAMALRSLIIRVYNSLQDTRTPMINSAIAVGLNIVMNLILIKYMKHAGLAFATSIAIIISTLLMFYGLKKKIGSLGTKGHIITFIKSGLASTVMGVVAYIVYHGLYGMLGVSKIYNLISLLAAVGLGVVVYGILCYVFNVEEVRDVVNKVIYRIKK